VSMWATASRVNIETERFCQTSVAHTCNPATQEAEIRKIMVRSQPGQIVLQDPISKNPSQKQGWWSGSKWKSWVQTPVLKEKERDFDWGNLKSSKRSRGWQTYPIQQ
jgi:hypothetical protein